MRRIEGPRGYQILLIGQILHDICYVA